MSDVVMPCTTHGMVRPEVDVVTNDDNQRVVEWHCPDCGEHLGQLIDAGLLDLTRLPSDRPRNDFQFFFENFEGLISTDPATNPPHTVRVLGVDVIEFKPLSRWERIKMHFATKLRVPRPWKPCVEIDCPPLQEYRVNWPPK